jgi:hypothetical protein
MVATLVEPKSRRVLPLQSCPLVRAALVATSFHLKLVWESAARLATAFDGLCVVVHGRSCDVELRRQHRRWICPLGLHLLRIGTLVPACVGERWGRVETKRCGEVGWIGERRDPEVEREAGMLKDWTCAKPSRKTPTVLT